MTKTSAIRVRTRFESVDDFVVGYTPFFDARGVFIRTRRLQEIGTRLRFELQLADGNSVFRGEGVVDEVRQPPLSAAGMHVRISKLDRVSKALFERMTGDLEHVGSDPFEAPTYDPDRPGLNAAETARVIAAASGTFAPAADEPEEAAVPGSRGGPTREHDAGNRVGDSSPLDAGVLDEIADGIEFSLDAVWDSSAIEASGPADFGGYFGSPDALAQAGLTPVAGQGVVADEAAAWSAPDSESSGESPRWVIATEPESAAFNFSPPIDEAELDDDNVYVSSQYEAALATDKAVRDLFDVSMEHVAVSAGDSDLGVDHSLALASNYAPEPAPSVLFDDAEPLEAERVGEPDEDEPNGDEPDEAEPEKVEPEKVEPELLLRTRHTSDEPDLQTLARSTLEHDIVEPASHRRYSFASEAETSGLGNLLSDLIETGGKGADLPQIDLAALTGEYDAQNFSDGGPDAIDELLAREAAAEGTEDKKEGFFGRLFGRKKK